MSVLRFLLGVASGLALSALAVVALLVSSQTGEPRVSSAPPPVAPSRDEPPVAPSRDAPPPTVAPPTEIAAAPAAPSPPALAPALAPPPAATPPRASAPAPAWRRNAAPQPPGVPQVAVVLLAGGASVAETLAQERLAVAMALPAGTALSPALRAAGIERVHQGDALHPEAVAALSGSAALTRAAQAQGAILLTLRTPSAQGPDDAGAQALAVDFLLDAPRGPDDAARAFQTLREAQRRARDGMGPQVVALFGGAEMLRGLRRFHAAQPAALAPLSAVLAARLGLAHGGDAAGPAGGDAAGSADRERGG